VLRFDTPACPAGDDGTLAAGRWRKNVPFRTNVLPPFPPLPSPSPLPSVPGLINLLRILRANRIFKRMRFTRLTVLYNNG